MCLAGSMLILAYSLKKEDILVYLVLIPGCSLALDARRVAGSTDLFVIYTCPPEDNVHVALHPRFLGGVEAELCGWTNCPPAV